MTTAQIIWAVLMAAQAVICIPLVLALIKETQPMLSEAFTTALNNLVAAFAAEVAAKQTALDAANAQIATLQSDAAAVDAAATAAVVAATPAPAA